MGTASQIESVDDLKGTWLLLLLLDMILWRWSPSALLASGADDWALFRERRK
jgi:hypothetical protein